MIFIEWFLGNHPDHSVLFLTSSDDMATKFNTAIRGMLESERYRLVFPDEACRPDRERGWSGTGLWLKGTPPGSKDPAFTAAGFTANIIGTRPHMIVLDDPRTQEQSQSETEQAQAHAYHDGTIVSRLHPDKPREVYITTRWHENDLAGHVLKQDGWIHRNLPALDENGESTWPERFPTEYVLSMRKLLGTAMFKAVWQGDATSLGGDVFREESWFRPLPANFDRREADGKTPRQRLNVVQFWDFAFSRKDTADYSACVTLGVDPEQNFYVLGVWRARLEEADLVQAVIEQWELFHPHAIGVERGIWDKFVVVRDLIRRVRQQIPVAIWPVEAKGDKVARARLPAARAENGMLFVDKEAPWAHDFIAECLAFDNGVNDDQVDALSGAAELAATKMAFMTDLSKLPRQHYSLGGKKRATVDDGPLAIGR